MSLTLRSLAALAVLAGLAPALSPTQQAPSTPTGFTGAAEGIDRIRWTWSDGTGETGYELHGAVEVPALASITQDQAYHLESVLTENTSYTRHLHAFNGVGLSGATASVVRWTRIHDPAASEFALSATSTSVSITPVQPPFPTGAGWRTTRSTDLVTWTASGFKTTWTAFTENNLLSGVKYYYRIQLRNGANENSAWSPIKSITTTAAAPTTSAGFTGTAVSTSSINWTWTDAGWESIYDIHDAAHTLIATRPENAAKYLETGLGENAQVVRHYHATNAAGQGAASTSTTAYTLVHDPLAADFTLTAGAGPSVAIVVTQPPGAALGNTGVEISRSLDGKTWTIFQNYAKTWTPTDTGVVAGLSYLYRIRYRNGSAVVTEYSAPKSVTLPAGVPPVPAGFAGTPQTTTSVLWSWTDGLGETSYRVYAPGDVVKGTLEWDQVRFLETGLAENTQVTRYVKALNASGAGAASASVSKYSLVRDPGLADFSLTQTNATTVTATVTLPPNVGVGSTAVLLQRSSTGSWSNVGTWTTASSIAASGLTAGTTYWFRIQYRNGDATVSATSPPKTLATVAPPSAVPPVPGSFTGTPTTPSSILWTWANVANEAGYRLHDAAHALVAAKDEDVVAHLQTGLTENQVVVQHVHAWNVVGESGTSTALTRYALVHDPVAADFSLASPTATSIVVTVTPPPNSTAASTGCQAEYSSNGVDYTAFGSVGQTYTITINTGLVGGQTFWVRFRYRNGGSTLTPYSPAKTVTTPAGVPPAPTGLSQTQPGTTLLRWTWTDVFGETGYVLHDQNHALIATMGAGILYHLENVGQENVQVTRHVHAVNGAGESAASSSLARYTMIHDPIASELTAVVDSPTQVTLTAALPNNAGVAGTACQIERSVDGNTWVTIKAYGVAGWSRVEPGLIPGMSYAFRVAFKTPDSQYTANSPPLRVTLPAGPPGVPVGPLVADVQTATTILWKWEDSSGETSFALHDAAEVVKGTTGVDVPSLLETGIPENTQVTRHVHGVNGSGAGPGTAPVSANTRIHDPTTADLTLTVLSDTEIRITIQAPVNALIGQTAAQLQRLDGANWEPVRNISPIYLIDEVALNPATAYTYRVRFRDSTGRYTLFSPGKVAQTMPAPPAPPANFHAVGETVTAITWAWDNVAGETGFEIHDPLGNLVGQLGPDVLSLIDLELSENTPYTRHIHSLGEAGAGGASPNVTRFTRVHDPVAGDFIVRVMSGTRVDIAVLPPPNGSAASTGCAIERSLDGSAWTLIKGFAAEYLFSDSGLSPETAYHYRIAYRNGDQVATSWSPPLIVATSLPAAPANLLGTAPSDSSILWSWDNIAGETSFELHGNPHAFEGGSAADALSYLETGLAENSSYLRHVHAWNGVGLGAGSAPASRYTGVRTPGPGDFTLSALSTTEIRISVLPPFYNSSTLQTGVAVEWSPNGSSWSQLQAASPVYTLNHGGLTPLTTYHYRIRFRNAEGVDTAWSPSRSAISVPQPLITTPSKTIRNATIAVQGTVTPGVTVNVYFNGTDKGPASVVGGSWTFSSPGNAEGVYTVTAKAFITAVPSEPSVPVSITVDLSAPAAPTNVRTTSFAAAVDVEWDASSSGDVVGYLVYRKTGAGGSYALVNTTGMVLGTKYRDTTILGGTTYYYKVLAVDGALPN